MPFGGVHPIKAAIYFDISACPERLSELVRIDLGRRFPDRRFGERSLNHLAHIDRSSTKDMRTGAERDLLRFRQVKMPLRRSVQGHHACSQSGPAPTFYRTNRRNRCPHPADQSRCSTLACGAETIYRSQCRCPDQNSRPIKSLNIESSEPSVSPTRTAVCR